MQVRAGEVKFGVNLITSRGGFKMPGRMRTQGRLIVFELNELINLTPQGLKSFCLKPLTLKSFSEAI